MSEKLKLIVPEIEDTLICNPGDRCEDCPDINPDPPMRSKCQYFENRSGTPACNREDGMQRSLEILISRSIVD